jgi:hypothetical protein
MANNFTLPPELNSYDATEGQLTQWASNALILISLLFIVAIYCTLLRMYKNRGAALQHVDSTRSHQMAFPPIVRIRTKFNDSIFQLIANFF